MRRSSVEREGWKKTDCQGYKRADKRDGPEPRGRMAKAFDPRPALKSGHGAAIRSTMCLRSLGVRPRTALPSLLRHSLQPMTRQSFCRRLAFTPGCRAEVMAAKETSAPRWILFTPLGCPVVLRGAPAG